MLRFDQRASVHQLLREYQMLGEILEDFFEREAAGLGARADAGAAVRALARATRAVRVLQQKTVDAFITKYTDTIERQTAQLRGFSRLARLTRRPDGSPCRQGVDLTALVHDVSTQLAEMADARDVRIDVEEGLPVLAADAGRVELVLMNLLANAVKYSDPGKASRTVRVECDEDRSQPRIRVRHNGIGISRAKRDVIFEQFVRVHAHLDDELGATGMGLGLSIVRESMEAMGGSVTVESSEGEGTTFTLTWPAASRTTSRS